MQLTAKFPAFPILPILPHFPRFPALPTLPTLPLNPLHPQKIPKNELAKFVSFALKKPRAHRAALCASSFARLLLRSCVPTPL